VSNDTETEEDRIGRNICCIKILLWDQVGLPPPTMTLKLVCDCLLHHSIVQKKKLSAFITGFTQLNLTIRQFQNDLQNQVAQVQEKIANISIAGNSIYHMTSTNAWSLIIAMLIHGFRYLSEPSQLMPADSWGQPQ